MAFPIGSPPGKYQLVKQNKTKQSEGLLSNDARFSIFMQLTGFPHEAQQSLIFHVLEYLGKSLTMIKERKQLPS